MKNQKNTNSKTTGNNEQTYILLLSARLVLMQRFVLGYSWLYHLTLDCL